MRFDIARRRAGEEAAGKGALGIAVAGTALRVASVAALAMSVANCGSQVASSGRSIDPKYGVAASPRVVAEGEPVPKGGGRELVGRPYVIAGRTYVPRENPHYAREGLASWYGSAFHGRLTANGEVFDRFSVAAAHPTLPLPSYARITNLGNHRSMIVRVNDRGPYHANRIMDVSEQVAEALDFRQAGTARVRVEYVGRASLRGSDDGKLMATLRDDGPAVMPRQTAPIMVADAGPAAAPPLAFRAEESWSSSWSERVTPPPQPAVRTSAMPAAAAPTAAASGPTVGAPLPPERPFDLGTTPRSRTPLRAVVAPARRPVAQLPPVRPSHAGLRAQL